MPALISTPPLGSPALSLLTQLQHILTRHARFLLLFFFCLCLLLVYHRQVFLTPAPSARYLDLSAEDDVPWEGRSRLSLQEETRLSERRYQEWVDERSAYVKRLGGKDAVELWPDQGAPFTLWDFLRPAFHCPYRLSRLGAIGDGGKWVCGMEVLERKRGGVLYSFGVSTDSSFEAAVLRSAGDWEVWGYDYSVPTFGPEIVHSPPLAARSHFSRYALGPEDAHGPAHDPTYQVYSLPTLMRLNRHKWIDLLKLDIEGSELAVLAALCAAYSAKGEPLPFGQLLVEVHAWDPELTFGEMIDWWEALEKAGLRPVNAEVGAVYVNLVGGKPVVAEYTFVNIYGRHELVWEDVG